MSSFWADTWENLVRARRTAVRSYPPLETPEQTQREEDTEIADENTIHRSPRTEGEALPEGVIELYRWGAKRIPSSGDSLIATEVLDTAVIAAMRERGIIGCGVTVCRAGKALFRRGYGYAQLPDVPFLPSTASRCGSLAKPITSLCALLLMDRGILDLDSRVAPLLAAVKLKIAPVDVGVHAITVRHLMDHTSGLPGGATYTAWRPNRDLVRALGLARVPTGRDVAADALNTSHLEAAPGERFEYANANFVILARVIECVSMLTFNEFLTTVAMPQFGVHTDEVFVSRNQRSRRDPARGKTEAVYYQTSAERYGSFVPADSASGAVFGEAYRGYATEASDGAGGIAVSVNGISRILANLGSGRPSISQRAMQEVLTPPLHYLRELGFDRSRSEFYSKGFFVRYSGGVPWLSHSGMTNHCGGIIGYNAGYQFAAVSNWNNAGAPYVDQILNSALTEAVARLS